MLDKSIEDLRRWFTADSLEAVKFVAEATKRAKGDSPLCFVVDDEPGICLFISATLDDLGVSSETFGDVAHLFEGLSRCKPDLIFLDVSLDRSDAVDAIRGLRERDFRGAIQLISGHDQALLEDIKLVGEERSLRMLPVLSKPFSGLAIRKIIAEQKLDSVESADQRIKLADALRQNWVEFWYQPKIDLREQRLVGVEALARVRRPNGIILTPGQFLPQADEASLLTLTEGALRAATRDGLAFAEAGFNLQVAVNVPASALLKLQIPAIVRESCSQSTPRPDLILEVTEDQIIDNLSYAFEVATQLKIYGVKLSLDDFGHGYSSLARLKALPFAELKIDRSFVAECDSDKANSALCTTIIDLAHRFDSVAVAEGIESGAELLALQRMGCDQGQGYLFARPMPKDLFLTLLRSRAGFRAPAEAAP